MLKNLFGQSRLARALQHNDLKLLLKSIKAGDDINRPLRLASESKDALERPPLEQALRLQQPESLQKLLEAGAKLPQRDAANQLLLTVAINSPEQALSLTSLLLDAGADPNADDGEPLFNCLNLSDDNQLLLLLNRLVQYGGNLNTHLRNGDSVLSRLLIAQRNMPIGALISAGAELPANLDQLNCNDELKQFARRKAQDLAIQRQLMGL